jgi:hypothetical protein
MPARAAAYFSGRAQKEAFETLEASAVHADGDGVGDARR